MSWLHRRKPVEAITDPASGELSMSRICSWTFFCLDLIWVCACIFKLPAKEAYAPVSGMLGTCTVAAFAAYGVNSGGGAMVSAWQNWIAAPPAKSQDPPVTKPPGS